MDLILLVTGLALIGIAVHYLTTKVEMDAAFIWLIRLVVIFVVLFYLLRRFSGSIPNML